MIGALLSGLFNLILNLLATLVQIVLIPLNALFDGLLPDFSTYINQIVSGLSQALSQIGWILSIIPQPVKSALLLIFTIEVTIFMVMRSASMTRKLWSLLQKLKFW